MAVRPPGRRRPVPPPREASPSFAQQDTLDDSDAEAVEESDLRSEVGSSEAYVMATATTCQLYTPDEEAVVRSKFDRKVVLFVALLYMLSFLDRSNIGNARIAGMEHDLQTTPPRDEWYQGALTAFYISYIAFEWMTLLYKLFPPHAVVSLAVLTWGIAASLQAVAPSYPYLVGLRVLLGIGEAGFAGIPFYLSFFYKREELAFRTAIHVSAAPLATSFASTLAYIIVKLASSLDSPIAPWRLLFLIEGFPSVIVSFIAWSAIPDSPGTAHFLSAREKKVAQLRLRPRLQQHCRGLTTGGVRPRELLALLADPVAWMSSAMFFLANMAYSSLPVFLPKIMTEMGHDPLTSQALCAPPYLLAFFAVLFTAHMSDRRRARAVPLVFHALASAGGYAVLALAQTLHLPSFLRYMAVYPAAVGFFNVVTLIITWNINNQASQTRQGGGFAVMQVVGQFGPLVGTRLYPDRDSPYYTRGNGACAVAMFAVAVLAIMLRMYLQHRNWKMDQAEKEHLEKGGAPVEEEQGLVGSGKRGVEPGQSFRYML